MTWKGKGAAVEDRGQELRGVPICIDGRMLGEGGTGVSAYARALALAIDRLTDQSCRLVARRTDDGQLAKLAGALRKGPRHLEQRDMLLEGRDVFRRAHVHFDLYRRLYPVRCDLASGIMHWTYPVPMAMEGWINLYTVHDAIPLDHPHLTSIDPRRHRAVLQAIIARGASITTVSQSARKAIVAALGCDPACVVDTSQPVDVGGAGLGALPAGFIPRGYFLVVGSIEPRKNLAAILAAYRASASGLPLVIAGPDGWQADAILADIAATPGVTRMAYADRGLLLTLIANARALVFPSLAEGFGLPIVEAMALGTPVLTSNSGAPAEIAGGAALTVDPASIDAIAEGLVRLALDDALVETLVARGRVRATDFSPDRFTARLADMYADALRARTAPSNATPSQLRRR